MKYGQLIENLPVWNKFLNVELAAECIKPVVTMHQALMAELDFVAQEKKSILEKYNGRIENGMVIIDVKEDVDKYNADIEYLMNGEIKVEPINLKSSHIGSKLSPALAITLKDLVNII
jgi:hypothetical protein